MDEVSSHVCLDLPSVYNGTAAEQIVPPRPRIPRWKGLGADSEEKHEPVSDIDTVVVGGLKALDPKWPIREADIVTGREWDGPAALPPPTALRVAGGGLSGEGAPSCLARPPFTQ